MKYLLLFLPLDALSVTSLVSFITALTVDTPESTSLAIYEYAKLEPDLLSIDKA